MQQQKCWLQAELLVQDRRWSWTAIRKAFWHVCWSFWIEGRFNGVIDGRIICGKFPELKDFVKLPTTQKFYLPQWQHILLSHPTIICSVPWSGPIFQQSHCDFLGNGFKRREKSNSRCAKDRRKWISLAAFEEGWQKQETDRLTTHIRQQHRQPQCAVHRIL